MQWSGSHDLPRIITQKRQKCLHVGLANFKISTWAVFKQSKVDRELFIPTEIGHRIAKSVVDIKQRSFLIQEQADADAGKLAGTVRITAVPVIINRVLVPSLHAL